jgi:hypothetical protein
MAQSHLFELPQPNAPARKGVPFLELAVFIDETAASSVENLLGFGHLRGVRVPLCLTEFPRPSGYF